MIKKKVVIAHGYFGYGGAEVATMWLIEALKDNYSVYILTRGGFNLELLNSIAGTKINATEIKVINPPLKFLLSNTKGGAIWHVLFLKYCKKIGKRFDFRITASRTIYWGCPAVHFLSDVVWNKELEAKFGEPINHKSFFHTLLLKVGEKIGGNSKYKTHIEDEFIANSNWTAYISSPYTKNYPKVIYPAVSASFKIIPLCKRKNEFVMLGRISPEKRIEDAVEIIETIRKNNYNVGLTIYGAFDNSDYSLSIKKLIEHKTWVKAPGAIYGEEKITVLPQFKYGINTCQREAFGISTAEMMKAGIITFVPKEGAQHEMVKCEDLIFNSIADATSKIMSVLDDEDYQNKLSESLIKRSEQFSVENFRTQVNSLLKSIE